MAEDGFDISKYITAQDVVAAVAAGAVAYLTYRTKQEEPKPEQPQATSPKGNAAPTTSTADPTIRVDHGSIDINDPKLWKDGGIVNMNGNQLHVFKAPDGSVIRVNPYQLQAAGGDPMKAAMSQFAAKVQNGQVDMDKLFAAGQTVTTPSGMPVTVNAPAGTNAQDAIATVRRGMTVDPLGAQPTASLDNLTGVAQKAQAALDSNAFGSLNDWADIRTKILNSLEGNDHAWSVLKNLGRDIPLQDQVKLASALQSDPALAQNVYNMAFSGSQPGRLEQVCRAVINSLNQPTGYNGTLVNTLSDF